MAYNAREVFTFRERRGFNDDSAEESAAELNGGIFLCLLNKNGTLGAAYYNFLDKTVSCLTLLLNVFNLSQLFSY